MNISQHPAPEQTPCEPKSDQPAADVTPLAAVAFDPAWAAREARLCRSRLLARGMTYIPVEDDELVSMISLVWWRVCCGDLGAFKPRLDKPVAAQVQAYVAGCIDHEVIRYLHQEGNPGLVHTPKRHNRAVLSFSLDESRASSADHDDQDGSGATTAWGVQLIDEADPLEILSRQETQFALPGWPGPIGSLLADQMERAHDYDKREARIMKARIEVEVDGKLVERANLAWVLIHAAFEGAPDQTRKLAPMLTARWVDGAGGTVKSLRAKVYPRLGTDITVAEVARQEIRDLLRFLAEVHLMDAAISPEHIRLVGQDAAAAMTKWVGKRGPYKKRTAEQPSPDDEAVDADGAFPEDESGEVFSPMQDVA